MKNLTFILILAAFIFSCQDEETTGNYSIEGKWRIDNSGNQMYIFQDGIRHTVFCNEDLCDWDAFTAADAAPNNGPYTFENDTLIVYQSGPGVSAMGGVPPTNAMGMCSPSNAKDSMAMNSMRLFIDMGTI